MSYLTDRPYMVCDNNIGPDPWKQGFGPNQTDRIHEAAFVVMSDYRLRDKVDHLKKIAVLLEPPSISPDIYSYVESHIEDYSYVLTYNKKLYTTYPNCRFYGFCGSWVKPEDRRVYEKTGNLCMSVSFKKQTQGHRFRHQCYDVLKSKIDYVVGYMNPTPITEIPQKNFRYNLCVENCWEESFFSEKLLDCFNTGCVPIYKGTPDIGKWFDVSGMILFDTLDELSAILGKIGEEDYLSRMKAIKNNLIKASKYSDFGQNLYNPLCNDFEAFLKS